MTPPKVPRGIEPKVFLLLKTLDLAHADDAKAYFDQAPEEVALELTELHAVRKFRRRYLVAVSMGSYVLDPQRLGYVERRFLVSSIAPALDFLLAQSDP